MDRLISKSSVRAQRLKYHTIGTMAILGTVCSKGSEYTIEVSTGKTIKCYTGPFNGRFMDSSNKPPFDRLVTFEPNDGYYAWETGGTVLTYCFPTGTGWELLRTASQLTFYGQANVTDLPYANLSVLTSVKSLYLPGSSNPSSCALNALRQGLWPSDNCQDGILNFSIGNSSLLGFRFPGMDETIFCPFNVINHFVDYSVDPVDNPRFANVSGERRPICVG